MNTRIRNLLLTVSALAPIALASALANPLGPQVVGGSAIVQGQGTPNVTVTQQSNSAIINWNTFNIGAGEKTNITMPSSSSFQLDRVTGNLGPSQIFGSLWSNGRVFLVNPDGILFGSGAVVDTAGFLATTHDIANADFMAGRYNFSIPGNPAASIVNQGTITAQTGGFAALVAPGVRNSGTITATLGIVTLASGNSFTLDFYGDKLITLGVNDAIATQVKDVATGQTLSSLVTNEGKLSANGGRVELTAAAARQVVDSVINTSGVIEANSVGTQNGMIVLGAATGASKPAGAPTQTVKVSGKLSAAGLSSGQKGGTIQITGENLALAGATIDASGQAGGGTVLIGGDTGGGNSNPAIAPIPQAQLQPYAVPTASSVTVDTATTIDASAKAAGDGGKVVVWSDGATFFNGAILATGGTLAGDGGFVETSGQVLSFANGRVDTSAPYGLTGSWLLDPYNLSIDSTAAAAIATSLVTTNVTIQTTASGSSGPGISNPSGNGDIFVNSDISWSSANSLTLSAYRNVAVDANITNTGGAAVNLRADNSGTGVGTVFFGEAVHVSTAGPVSIFYNPSVNPAGSVVNPTSYKSPTENFTGEVTGGGFLTAYMLVNTVYDLQNVRNNLLGPYALGRNIDASGTATWNGGAGFVPIGPNFSGLFNGDGWTVSGLTIAPTAASIGNIGLFGQIGATGVVENLNLTNVNIHANPNWGAGFQNVGALVGQNFGLINHVTASGTINGGAVTGIFAGGLAGQNGFYNGSVVSSGTIENSSAAVNVTLGDGVACSGNPCTNARNDTAGGLVGHNIATITNSSASGAIVVGANAQAGGLVGLLGFVGPGGQTSSGALITSSFATGTVFSAGVNVNLGGLVGNSAPSAMITSSYATGAVTATAPLTFAPSGVDCSIAGNCQYENVGGLVGHNSGTIQGAAVPSPTQGCVAGQTCATGTVSVGSDGHGGGLAGNNWGIIENAFATGTVTGAAGLSNDVFLVPNVNTTRLGGLVGVNQGLITDSHATGNVGTLGVADLHAGGLAGGGNGAIVNSYETGNVSAGDTSLVGGLVALNPIYVACGGCVGSDGYAYFNTALISNSYAIGNVTAGAGGVAGGLAGLNFGTVTGSWASGTVVVGDNASAGGLVGFNNGSVTQSYATSAVSSAGANVELGGLVGVNTLGATITSSYAAGDVTATANAAPCSTNCQFADVGGLVGQNNGTISGTSASGDVVVGNNAEAGGLVGTNGIFGNNNQPVPAALIDSSFATGNVSSAGVNVSLGGLAGSNAPGATIARSYATGVVTESAAIAINNNVDCSISGNCQYANAGGLVGQNWGTIQGAAAPPPLNQPCATGQACATGAVSVGSHGTGGGLVGFNAGIIINAFATGAVTGAAGAGGLGDHGATNLGGLAAANTGLITGSFASGNVGTLGVANLQVGGLVGDNSGKIDNSFATGNVRAGDNSSAGGLTSDNSTGFSVCNGCIVGDGSAYFNAGLTSNSYATGNVTVGAASLAGGLTGSNDGTINNSHATGAVTGGGNSILGGLAGVTDIPAVITNSAASGPVSSMGTNSWVGGFVGANGGSITGSIASGPVTGTSNSLLGGFVGYNLGVITNSTAAASATVTGTGTNNFDGGFVGINIGLIDPSTAAGAVTGGADNVVGGFAGANASFIDVPAALAIPGSSFPNGTVSADSVASGAVTGGAGSTVGAEIGTSYPTTLPTGPSIVSSCQNGGLCSILQADLTLAPPPAPPSPLEPSPIAQTTQLVSTVDTNVTTQAPILVSNTTSSSPDSAGSSPNAAPGKPEYVPPPLPRRLVPGPNGEIRSSLPPPGENRFLQNQVLLQLGLNISEAELTRIVAAIDARVVTSEALDLLGRRAIRLELPAGMTVRDAILRLEENRLVSVAAPIYQFHLTQSAGAAAGQRDPGQYILGKLHLDGAHRLATGKGVAVALIDSEVDQKHIELQGAISEELDAIGQKEPPHSHGTAMAGAIVSHDRLVGVAPGARILAVHAFGEADNSAEATTVSILKGIEWAVDQGARVINMSFTGPRDPSLERAFKAAHEKGVVLVAAAGNDGPKSPPLYPGADPNVIAVTATDAHDGLLREANWGPQLSVAAPGVKILTPAPEGSYQISTGTSIATAHVSGVVALMLERDPTLKPDEVRKILEETATDLGPPGKDNQFGWGLVNPQKALEEITTHRKVSDASAKIR